MCVVPHLHPCLSRVYVCSLYIGAMRNRETQGDRQNMGFDQDLCGDFVSPLCLRSPGFLGQLAFVGSAPACLRPRQ